MCGLSSEDETIYLVRNDGWYCKECLESIYGSMEDVDVTSSDDIEIDEYEHDVFDDNFEDDAYSTEDKGYDDYSYGDDGYSWGGDREEDY